MGMSTDPFPNQMSLLLSLRTSLPKITLSPLSSIPPSRNKPWSRSLSVNSHLRSRPASIPCSPLKPSPKLYRLDSNLPLSRKGPSQSPNSITEPRLFSQRFTLQDKRSPTPNLWSMSSPVSVQTMTPLSPPSPLNLHFPPQIRFSSI